MNNEKVQKMRDLVKTQGQKGNFDQGDYMLGMYNGMELMLAIVEGREPDYKLNTREGDSNE